MTTGGGEGEPARLMVLLGLIGQVARTHPFKFGCVFSCAKTSFSDWLVQRYIEKRERIDWKRNMTFASFGLVYLGGVQYSLYVPVFGRLFPNAASYAGKSLRDKLADAVGSRSMVAQVVIDQFVHHPFLYFPAFYSLKEVVNGGLVTDGLAKYKKNYKEDLVALWKLWVPSTIINFAFMPMHMRIPWVATTSLFWTCILSYMRGSEDVPAELIADVSEDVSGNQGRALSAMLDWRVAAKPAYQYDPAKSHMLVSATGRDRIGFVAQLSRQLRGIECNVLDAKMYKVGLDFVTVMLIESDPARSPEVVNILTSQEDMSVNILPTDPARGAGLEPEVEFMAEIHLQGGDEPGVLERLCVPLADMSLDITALSCHQAVVTLPGKQEEEKRFTITGMVRAFTPRDVSTIRAQLEELEPNWRIGIVEVDPNPNVSAFGEHLSTRNRKLSRKDTTTHHKS